MVMTQDAPHTDRTQAFDVFVLAGQSNLAAGRADSIEVGPFEDIFQLGRDHPANATFGYGNPDLAVIPAREPLQHHSMASDLIGFPMVFAAHYLTSGLLPSGRQILLIPCAAGGCGFSTTPGWMPDGEYVPDLVRRCRHVLEKHPGSEIKAVLWHQGEADIMSGMSGKTYARHLETLITNIRSSIGVGDESLPFILGNLVHDGVLCSHERGPEIEEAIFSVPARLKGTAVVHNDGLESNDEVIGDGDRFHFSARAQIELGARYFDAYLHLLAKSLQRKITSSAFTA